MQVVQHITELQGPPHNNHLIERPPSFILLLLQCLTLNEFHHQVGFAAFLEEIADIG